MPTNTKSTMFSKIVKTSQPLLKVAGFRLEYMSFGDQKYGLWRRQLSRTARRRVLLLTPGLADSPANWLPFLFLGRKTLASQFSEVVMIDFPGFPGLLNDHPAIDSADDLFSTYLQVVRAIDPNVMFGHSMGGWLSAHYAIEVSKESPKSKRGLEKIFIASPSGLDNDEVTMEDWGAKFISGANGQNTELMDPRLQRILRFVPMGGMVANELIQFMHKKEVSSFIHSFDRRHLLEDRIEHLDVPTTVIWGTDDQVNPFTWAKEWERRLSHLGDKRKIVALDDTGHIFQVECPKTVAQIVSESLIQEAKRADPAFASKVGP